MKEINKDLLFKNIKALIEDAFEAKSLSNDKAEYTNKTIKEAKSDIDTNEYKKKLDKRFFYKDLIKLVKSSQGESILYDILQNILEMDHILSRTSTDPYEKIDQVQDIVNDCLDALSSYKGKTSCSTDKGNGFVTISSTVELSEYEKILVVAKRKNMTISKMLAEWFNWVINDPSLLKTTNKKRLDHTGHTFKRIACCIPSSMANLLDHRLKEAGISRYQCIKIWVNGIVYGVDYE